MPLFKKSFFVSICGHLALFGIFSFSFGQVLSQADYPVINCPGSLLSNYDLAIHQAVKKSSGGNLLPQAAASGVRKIQGSRQPALRGDKPAARVSLSRVKKVFSAPRIGRFALKKKPAIMFYPRLPNYFSVYFQDRQVVHIELLFNITAASPENTLTVKRSISSGNLEADLLSMRHISNYLFIQKPSFSTNGWQPVKIDLSFDGSVNDSY